MAQTSPSAPHDRSGFEIALICALSIEADAVLAVFDKFWAREGINYEQAETDDNAYTTGVIGCHNVVLAHMPGMGKVNAAGVAASLKSSFSGIKLALVVGICGGVPSGTGPRFPIYLGDLIISTAIIQYDFGRQYPKVFEKRDTLEDNPGRPSIKLRSILAKLNTRHYKEELQIDTLTHLRQIEDKIPEAKYLGIELDHLYDPSNIHKHHVTPGLSPNDACLRHPDAICEQALKTNCQDLRCWERESAVGRDQGRSATDHKPAIHFGRIGSGDMVMKSGVHRDQIAKDDKIIGFEMEGSGVWDYFPSLVVKGVCDYADSHKNKDWQDHAAAVAAAGMKAILKQWNPAVSAKPAGAPFTDRSIGTEVRSSTPQSTIYNNYGHIANQTGQQTIHGSVYHGTVYQGMRQPPAGHQNTHFQKDRSVEPAHLQQMGSHDKYNMAREPGDIQPHVFGRPAQRSAKSFSRHADQVRQERSIHASEILLYECPNPGCNRKGDNGFTRLDHLVEHRRGYHNQETITHKWSNGNVSILF